MGILLIWLQKEVTMSYEAKFLSWCKSYRQEVQTMVQLIQGNPADVELLKQEYEQLTGEEYND